MRSGNRDHVHRAGGDEHFFDLIGHLGAISQDERMEQADFEGMIFNAHRQHLRRAATQVIAPGDDRIPMIARLPSGITTAHGQDLFLAGEVIHQAAVAIGHKLAGHLPLVAIDRTAHAARRGPAHMERRTAAVWLEIKAPQLHAVAGSKPHIRIVADFAAEGHRAALDIRQSTRLADEQPRADGCRAQDHRQQQKGDQAAQPWTEARRRRQAAAKQPQGGRGGDGRPGGGKAQPAGGDAVKGEQGAKQPCAGEDQQGTAYAVAFFAHGRNFD